MRIISSFPFIRLKNTFVFFAPILLIGCLTACRQPEDAVVRNGVLADRAMVVSAHPEASRVGVDVLRAGGNAIDAAVAVHFALAVVYPEAGNIGGGGFLLYRQHDRKVDALDFREKAPAAATRDMFLDSSGRVLENRSLIGHLASGVPGSVAGMVEAHRRYGSMSWSALLQPAIQLAENGFAVTKRQADRLNENLPDFVRASTMSCSWFREAKWKEGDLLRQPELAATLIRVRDEGNGGFYAGKTARLLVEEMERGCGLITLEDLQSYRAIWREPVRGWYKNYHLISMGPPSSGGIALIQMLKMLEHYPELSITSDKCRRLHLIAEIQKRAFADRAQYLGDADLVPVPVEALLDSGYLVHRASEIRLNRAAQPHEFGAGSLPYESPETTHFSIVDPSGNAVAVTTTINDSFGSRVVVGGAGFFLNNQMDDFSLKPGHQNLFGLTGGEANAIAPGKRMLSSMTPTIVEQQDSLFMVLGSPGGSRIITSVLQVFLNTVDLGMDLQSAVNAGRFHHQGIPDTLFMEQDLFRRGIADSLAQLGHTVVLRKEMGAVDVVMIMPDGKRLGAADPRGDDRAMGF